jgi:hypothetical protein
MPNCRRGASASRSARWRRDPRTRPLGPHLRPEPGPRLAARGALAPRPGTGRRTRPASDPETHPAGVGDAGPATPGLPAMNVGGPVTAPQPCTAAGVTVDPAIGTDAARFCMVSMAISASSSWRLHENLLARASPWWRVGFRDRVGPGAGNRPSPLFDLDRTRGLARDRATSARRALKSERRVIRPAVDRSSRAVLHHPVGRYCVARPLPTGAMHRWNCATASDPAPSSIARTPS